MHQRDAADGTARCPVGVPLLAHRALLAPQAHVHRAAPSIMRAPSSGAGGEVPAAPLVLQRPRSVRRREPRGTLPALPRPADRSATPPSDRRRRLIACTGWAPGIHHELTE